MWALIASLYIGNLMLLVLNLPLAGIWVKLLRIPRPYLYAGILMFAALGSYTVNLSPIDLALLLVLGALGFFFRRYGWPVAPAIVGLILGPLAEQQLRRALAISQGDVSILFSSAFSLVLYAATALVLVVPVVLRLRRGLRGNEAKGLDADPSTPIPPDDDESGATMRAPLQTSTRPVNRAAVPAPPTRRTHDECPPGIHTNGRRRKPPFGWRWQRPGCATPLSF